MPESRHPIFRAAWWGSNLLLAVALIALVYSGVREFSATRYLDGYSDAIVADFVSPEERVEAILDWMRAEPSRGIAADPATLPTRDPQTTLNHAQLLKMCGTATNAFLNLARASDLEVRRLRLLSSDGRAKQVVAEVLINQRWIVVDPSYRVIMKDAHGHFLTRHELQDPATSAEAVGAVSGYPREYDYKSVAHARLSRLPLEGLHLRRLLDWVYPGWQEAVDGSLLLERESFLYLVLAGAATLLFLLLRQFLGWSADSRLRIPRFHFREHMLRAGSAFFSTPEIKE